MELIGLYTVHKRDKGTDCSAYPIHSHSSYEILMMPRGECSVVIGDTEYTLDRRRAALICSDVTHGLITNGRPFEFLAVQFIPRVCESAALDSLLQALKNSCGECGAVYEIGEQVYPAVASCMQRICDERADTDTSMYFTYIKAILYELLHNSVPVAGVTVRRKNSADAKTILLNAVTDYIGSNLDTITDLSFIESVFHYSNSHVNRIFRSYLGVSVWQYVTVKRLDLAYNLLSDGYDAKTAAIRSGFGDYSVFYKSFVRHFGISPSKIKRGNK